MNKASNKGLDVSDSAERVEPKATGKCPLCGKDTLHKARPFCSTRCANVDLNRWLSQGYAVTDPDE